MVCRVQKRSCGIANFLNQGGKPQLVKSVLASMPISFMRCLDIPVTIKEQVIKYTRHCLWRKKDAEVQAKGLLLGKKVANQKSKVDLVS
jgi:hypothetical protein